MAQSSCTSGHQINLISLRMAHSKVYGCAYNLITFLALVGDKTSRGTYRLPVAEKNRFFGYTIVSELFVQELAGSRICRSWFRYALDFDNTHQTATCPEQSVSCVRSHLRFLTPIGKAVQYVFRSKWLGSYV